MPDINISILGHIALDSDLNGRIGVQGNTFINTIGYLNQFFERVKSDSSILSIENRDQLSKLALAMADLAAQEAAISRLDFANDKELTRFVEKNAESILALSEGEALMLPGGWQNADGGHAMIYQFQKGANGGLIFSIYNAGAGLEQHDKLSTTKTEQYYPVKSFEIPSDVSFQELGTLISRLTTPMLLHPLRKERVYNAEKLYRSIDESLPFLKAKQIMATGLITTAGQLSGTCAERSLHQMLKLNFDTIPNYQRFILDFKVYAIRDYINMHPVPRSLGIAHFIQLAIENTLKILQEEDVFKHDLDEKNRIVDELVELKMMVLMPAAIKPRSTAHHTISHTTTRAYQLQTNQPMSYDEPLSKTSSKLTRTDPITLHDKSPLLLDDINAFIDQCRSFKDSDPMWVFDQIEQAMIHLPIPSKPISHTRSVTLSDYYDDIPLYSHISDNNQFEQMAHQIEALQAVYTETAKTLLNKTPTPSLYVTQCSFLALRDYCDVQQCKQDSAGKKENIRPSFHAAINESLGGLLRGTRACPYIATGHPEYDRRWVQLRALYDDTKSETAISSYHGNDSSFYSAIYNALLDTEPELKRKLEALFEQKSGKIPQSILDIDNKIDELLKTPDLSYQDYEAINTYRSEWYEKRSKLLQEVTQQLDEASLNDIKVYQQVYNCMRFWHRDFRALYCFLEKIQLSEPICLDSQFIRLKEKVQQQINLEKFYIHCFSSLLGKSIKDDTPVSLEFEENRVELTFKTPGFDAWIPRHGYYMPSEYKLKQSPAHHALREDYSKESILLKRDRKSVGDWVKRINGSLGGTKFGSNIIQLLPNDMQSQSFITKNSYLQRQFFHLRTSPALQINLTLDTFAMSIDKLQDLDIQAYVEANLLESGLLLDLLDKERKLAPKDQLFLPRFDRFIEKGLRHFKTPLQLPSQSSLFFMRLSFSLNRYMAEETPTLGGGRLKQDTDRLNAAIKVSVDQGILASLHQYRFLTLMTRYALHDIAPSDLNEAFAQAFESYCYIHAKSNPEQPDDLLSQFELKRTESLFKEWMGGSFRGDMNACIMPMINTLGLDASGVTLTGDYPEYTLQNHDKTCKYLVDAQLGLVFQDNKAYSNVPLDILHHPVMRQLGLEHEVSCFALPESQQFEFLTASQHVRMKKTNKGLFVQKKWTIDGVDDWYELQPLTPKQQERFALGSTCASLTHLPDGLMDASTAAWVKHDQQGSFIAQNGMPVYRVNAKNQLEQLDLEGDHNGLILSTPLTTHDALTQFENEHFFQLNLNSKNPKVGKVDFIRYGLSLEIEDHLIKLPNTAYHLASPSASPFKAEVAQLTFEDTFGTPKICMVPVQPFYVNLSQDGIEKD